MAAHEPQPIPPPAPLNFINTLPSVATPGAAGRYVTESYTPPTSQNYGAAALEQGLGVVGGVIGSDIVRGSRAKAQDAPNSVRAMQETYRQNVLYADTFGGAKAAALKDFARKDRTAGVLDQTYTGFFTPGETAEDRARTKDILSKDYIFGNPTTRQKNIADALRDPANSNLAYDASGNLQWSPSSGFDDPNFGTIPTNEMKKSRSIWGKIGVVAGIAGAAAATFFTGGAASPLLVAAVGGATAGGAAIAKAKQQQSDINRKSTNEQRGVQNKYKLDVLLDQLKNPGRELKSAASASFAAKAFDAQGQGDIAKGLRSNKTFNLDDDFKWSPPPGLTNEFAERFPSLTKKQADSAIKAALENRIVDGKSQRYKNLPQSVQDAIDEMEREDEEQAG